MAEERSLTVDTSGYEQLMKDARVRSRGGGTDADPVTTMSPDILSKLDAPEVGPTDDEAKFAGQPIESIVRAIWDGKSLLEKTGPTEHIGVILDRTPFYGEQGGQIGDTGRLEGSGADGAHFQVEQTIRLGDFVLHVGQLKKGILHLGNRVLSTVDAARRDQIKSNHTATHLLNLALRSIAGPHSDQRGSLVAPDRLRFDYAADRPLKSDELAAIEQHVCDRIKQDLRVYGELVPLDSAQSIETARAIFGEQYPDPVRVLSIGTPIDNLLEHPSDEKFNERSVEFCGGTHLDNTGEADDFVLLSEQGLAAGIRRVIAVTGDKAKAARAEATSIAERIKEINALDEEQLPDAADELARGFETAAIGAADRAALTNELDALRKRAKKARKQAQSASKGEMVQRARAIASESTGPFVVARMDGADRDGLLAAMDTIRGNNEGVAVLLLAADEDAGKVFIVSRVPDLLIDKGLKAGDWVKVAAQACGGGGGGRPDSAQAGGKDPARAEDALEAARAHAESTL